MRRALVPALMVGLLAVIVIGLWPSSGSVTAEQRVERLASNIRCPACNGAAIADAHSSVARDLMEVIEDQVEAGFSDEEVYDYFALRFGESALLSPPARGWGLWLVILPAAALVVGVGLLLSLRRRRLPSRPGVADVLADGIDAIDRDIAELERQVSLGEIDEATAARLQRTYEEERTVLTAERATGSTEGGRHGRVLGGAAFLLVGALAIGVALGLIAREGGGVAGAEGVVAGASGLAPADLSDVSNEQLETVVAENPNVIPMRVALARRYFDSGDFSNAIRHYFEVLDREPNVEALANLGWISFVNQETEAALGYLDRSLAIDPGYPDALWFLAQVRYFGLNDGTGALAPLLELLEDDRLVGEDRVVVEDLVETIRSGG